MKSNYDVFLVSLFVFFFGKVAAQNSIDVLSGASHEIKISMKTDDWELVRVNLPHGTFYQLLAAGSHAIREKGCPDLPKFVRSFIIPDSDLMTVEVIQAKFKDYKNVDIAPSKGHFLRNQNPDSIPFTFGEWYTIDAFYPGNPASLRDPYIIRDYRGQVLEIYPFQYNAVTKQLRIYTELTLKIISTGQTGINVLKTKKETGRILKEFHEIYRRQFVNYEKNLRYTPLEEEGSMLIICYDDFMSAMEPFVEWKNTIGLSTEMIALSSVGTTPSEIKTYISNYYNSENLAYVLFVGDAEQIPPYTSGVIEGYSDNAYGYLSGSDRYQEIFVGRFSAQNTAQVQTQVQRSIEYEQAYNFNNGWLHKGLGIARNEGAGNGHNGGEADYVHMDIIRDKLLTYTYDEVYREYDGNVPGLTNTTSAAISQKINDGVSVINFCNHGSVTGWSVAGYNYTHVNALTNSGKLPFIWAVACVNGQFQGQTCFAEYWLRATDISGNPTGAVSVFMSTINQPWHPPMDAQDEFNDIMIGSYSSNIKRSYGGLSINGVYKMLDLNPDSYGYRTAETWTIFGDPSLKIRTDDATAMIVSHDPFISDGSDFFEVICDTEGAYAAISLNGEILITATATGGGINLNTTGLEIGDEVTLAITGYNRIPYITQLEVLSAGPYANFTADPLSPAIGESVTFTDASGGGEFATWEWNFGDAATPVSAIGPGPHDVIYSTAGGKTISLIVDGVYSRIKENYVQVRDLYTLTIDVNGSGSVEIDGMLYSDPIILPEGTTLSLQASPDIFNSFNNWTGDLESSSNPINLFLDEDKNITANFVNAVTATYNAGDIPTDSSFPTTNSFSACPATLSVVIPSDVTINGIDVSYQMTALNYGWMSEQRSQVRCVSPGGISESSIASGASNTPGTFVYDRQGLDIANGVSGGGEINFELHAGRTWSSYGYTGCLTYNNKVDNNTWKIRVYYTPVINFPVVETSLPEEISSTSALVGGVVTDDGGGDITEYGIYWSTAANPELTGSKMVIGNGVGAFSALLNGLTPKTTYYVKAYAINSSGTSFGDEMDFTTPVHSNVLLEDLVISSSMDTCYDASETITTAGNGSVFLVEPDALVELVAGQSIHLLEGTHIKNGSYFLARITSIGEYCINPEIVIKSETIEVVTHENKLVQNPSDFVFNVFPNPTSGIIYLNLDDDTLQGSFIVSIFNAMGEIIIRETCIGSRSHQYDLSNRPKGIYFIHIVHGKESGVAKIMLQ